MLKSADTWKQKCGFEHEPTVTSQGSIYCEKMLGTSTVKTCVPSEKISYFWALQQVNQQINRVFSCQSTVTIHNNVEHELESLVDVLRIKKLTT